jgi:hypothetical protein
MGKGKAGYKERIDGRKNKAQQGLGRSKQQNEWDSERGWWVKREIKLANKDEKNSCEGTNPIQ